MTRFTWMVLVAFAWTAVLSLPLAAQEEDEPGMKGSQEEEGEEPPAPKKKKKGKKARFPGLPPLNNFVEALDLDEETAEKVRGIYKDAVKEFRQFIREAKEEGTPKSELKGDITDMREELLIALEECLGEDGADKIDEVLVEYKKRRKEMKEKGNRKEDGEKKPEEEEKPEDKDEY